MSSFHVGTLTWPARASVVVVSLGVSPDDQTNGPTIAAPAGIVAGNLLFAMCWSFRVVNDFTPPAGWSVVGQNQVAGFDGSTIGLFVKTATGSEPASYTFANSNGFCVGEILQLHNATAVDGHNFASIVSISVTPASLTPTGSADLWLVVGATNNGPTTTAAPSGWTYQENASLPNGLGLCCFTKQLQSSAPTGTRLWGFSAGTGGQVAAVLIK